MSKIDLIEDIISSLDMNTDTKEICQGMFHTGVVTRNCGLAASLPRDAMKQSPPLVKEPGILHNKTPRELVQLVFSESILEAAIGMASVNSLLYIDESSCIELNARDLIAEKGEGRKIAVVGHFPFLNRLSKISKKLWVIEKNPRQGDLPEDAAEKYIPDADIVAITGTAFTNHTIEDLLELCQPDAYVVILGDTTPLSPVLFDYGVDAISGTIVTDQDLALQCIMQGANFRQIRGIRKLIMKK